MKFAKNALTKKADNVLISVLSHALGGWQPARSFKTLHASTLTGEPSFCPREAALAVATKKKLKDRYISAAMRVAFDNGDALHELLRNKWLRDIAVGDWQCGVCKNIVEFSRVPKTPCKCKANLWTYKEMVFHSKTLPMTGSIDVVIDLGMGLLKPVEIKSIDKDQFADLVAPLAEHRVRTNLYMYLIKDSENYASTQIDTTSAKILYISKGFGKKSTIGEVLPFKEFDVPYNEEALTPYLKRATAYGDYRKTKIMPYGICKTSFESRAQQCNCLKECWSKDFPAGAKKQAS